MNKKQFARIKALYKDGVSKVVCITSIIEMSKSHTEAAIFIDRFFEHLLRTLSLELRAWQDVERRRAEIETGITLNNKEKGKDG